MSQKPIAVFDIDGTIFRSSLVIEMTNTLIDIGVFPKQASRKYEREYEAWLNRHGSYEDYLNNVVDTFAEYITGLRTTTIEEVGRLIIDNLAAQTYRYTRDLIKQLRSSHFIVAISGSPEELVAHFARIYEFDAYTATRYHHQSGVFNGEVTIGSRNKDETVKRFIKEHDLSLEKSIGVGDTESDEAFLRLVERPIAFNPNQRLYQAARQAEWEIIVERKDQIYHLTPKDGAYVVSEAD